MSTDTDEVTGDDDASRALIVQATEQAIVASFATVSEPPMESAGTCLGDLSTEVPSDAGPSVACAEAALPGIHHEGARMVMPSAATAAFGSTAFNPTAFNSTLETAMTTAEDFMTFNQANIEAFVKSSQIWAAGVQDLGKHMAATAQAQLDQTMSTWKAMAGVKSVKEALDMHTGLARTAIETAVSETGKLTDASMKLSEQAFAPITARLSITAEKFGRVAA